MSLEITSGTIMHRIIVYFVLFNILMMITVNIIASFEDLLNLIVPPHDEISDPVLLFFYTVFKELYTWLKNILTKPRNVALILSLDILLQALALRPRRGGVLE
ncbi:MAG: hypothetical protein QXJ64_03525 [Thermosphaera sp.]